MRILTTLLLSIIHLSSFGQSLRNTEWIKIKCERKDGSRIIDHLNLEKSSLKYYFKEKTVLISTNEQYSYELKYSVNKDILSIGDFITYQIDTVNNIILSITEVFEEEMQDDKINSFLFIKSNFLFEYLNQTNQVSMFGDTLLQCDNLISPTYKGSFDKLFEKQFHETSGNGILTGTLVISAVGNINSVQYDKNTTFSKSEIEIFDSIISSTNGAWLTPITGKQLQFKMDFTFYYYNDKQYSVSSFLFHVKNPERTEQKRVTVSGTSKHRLHFEKGVKYFNKGKFEKAIIEFTKCIEIDSLSLDSYYNVASSYQKLGNNKLACETWKKLKDMGQRQAEYLFIENCN